jgi:hypothetical protein
MISREQLLQQANDSGLSPALSLVRKLLLEKAAALLTNEEPPDDKQRDLMLLNGVGPASANAAVDYAMKRAHVRGQLTGLTLNGSITHNVNIIQNTPTFNYDAWSGDLRQYLSSRAVSYDQGVDAKHKISQECGYPTVITPAMYRYLYDRDDVACRVNDIYPDESWAVDPDVFETESEDDWTPFETKWQDLCQEKNLIQYLYRLDKLSGVGHFGAMIIGLNDGKKLDQPVDNVEDIEVWGKDITPDSKEILYLRPFDEYLTHVAEREKNPAHPRFGQPTYYEFAFGEVGGPSFNVINQRVHWTRVHHFANNTKDSDWWGTPRMEPVFDRLLDLRKIKGGSAEMFWQGAFPGLAFEIDPRFVADKLEFDEDALKEEIADYATGLQRYLRLIGIRARSLAPQVANPEPHVTVQLRAISSHYGVPIRIFMGSEQARLASSQDSMTWNRRLGRRLKLVVEPFLLRAFIRRLMAMGVMPRPSSGKFFIGWGDLNTTTDEDKANLSLKWTQAMSQYVATGMIHLIKPMDYLTIILGLRPKQAKIIVDYAESKGGFEKLLKVKPGQGAGINGVRQNITDPNAPPAGASGGRKVKRPKADKQIEGGQKVTKS